MDEKIQLDSLYAVPASDSSRQRKYQHFTAFYEAAVANIRIPDSLDTTESVDTEQRAAGAMHIRRCKR